MSFEEQLLPGENLVILTRQHPLVLFRPVLVNLVVLIILTGLALYLQKGWIAALSTLPLLYLIWEYIEWRRREYIVTNRRVVLQEGILSRSSFDAALDKVNNVYCSHSCLGRLLKYGEVRLETASEQGMSVFSFLLDPIAFRNSILSAKQAYSPSTGTTSSSAPAPVQGIPQLIEELASLRDRGIISEAEFQEKKRSLLEKL